MKNPSRRRILKAALAIGAATAGGAAWLLPRRANAYYRGPASDHFDGHQFFNPGGRNPQRQSRLFDLYFRESWSRWPGAVPIGPVERPPERVDGAKTRLQFIGHASWLIQAAGLNLLVDPVWSERASPVSFAGPKRVSRPGVMFDHLPRIDAVLVTHNHYDHLDVATLARLWRRDRPRIVTPLGNDAVMQPHLPGLAANVVDWGHDVQLSNALRVHAEPTQHWSARGLRDRRHALWASFVIATPAGRIYVVGDSGFGDGRTFRHVASRHPDIALALLPIGAYEPRWFMRDQHMNPEDAVKALTDCGAEMALAHHHGTFQLTDEAIDAPVNDLATALDAAGVARDKFVALKPGQVFEI